MKHGPNFIELWNRIVFLSSLTQRSLKEGSLKEGNLTEENLTEGSLKEGNLTEENLTEGNLTEENLIEENLKERNLIERAGARFFCSFFALGSDSRVCCWPDLGYVDTLLNICLPPML
ncbi:hypothetical protein [Bartonella queenslandensis]|uniref:hypothetical protein n=1 Tax=Bartonella queenslandensis TaxID=481138 RepID=UPI00031DD327|nr:hypothetical protein [Bartonella queenslandensis]